ncbi:Trafficking protein particle complex subunit [Dillenia turbinata]|uniref:Trafficking protein particle complex subunit n=1 Tax=Dillenia turbinata TaxID=194707 RepID=A0AAN8UZJ0_9MAGN
MQFFSGSEISPSPPAPTASGNNAHMMYVFNRNGICLLYREWNRPLRTLSDHQDHKLMFGLLFSLKSLTAKMDPTSLKFHLFCLDLITSYSEVNGSTINCGPDLKMIMTFLAVFCSNYFIINMPSHHSMDKGNLGVPQLPGQGCSFHSFRTNTYKLSFMETPSGIKIILVTNPRTGDLREPLKYIYNLYVEHVVKNPLYTPGTPIK